MTKTYITEKNFAKLCEGVNPLHIEALKQKLNIVIIGGAR